jgi:hypothetical protein
MKLFVNGCSFTHGHKGWDNDKNPPDWVWPSIMSSNFEETVNLAWQGGSNARIVRTTLDFFDNVKDPKNWLAVIQWSAYIRLEFHDEESGTYFGFCGANDQPVLTGPDTNKFINIPIRFRKKILYHLESIHTQSNHQLIEQLVYHQYILSEFFTKKNIKFLFTGMNSSSQIPRDFEHPLLKLIPHNNVLLPMSHLVNNRTPNLLESDTDSHPNKLGHTVIANYITNELKQRNYL